MAQYTLGELAVLLNAELKGGNESAVITALAPLECAHQNQLSFFADAKYKKQLLATHAEAVLLNQATAAECPVPCLIVENPGLAFIAVAKLFERPAQQAPGIHATVVVGERCCIDETASIGAYCVLGNDVTIGANTVLCPGTIISNDVAVGRDCLLHARVTLYAGTVIGSRVIIHSGAVIGSDGFGNLNHQGKWVKIPQLGGVCIGDDVEIGANTTIDRGALGNTVIEEGVRLDNLIQIAHNVRVGAHTAMAAQVGIAGSTTIGKHCMLGGKVAVNGHIHIADQVIVTATSAVPGSIDKSGVYSSGTPILPQSSWLRNVVCFNKLHEIYKRLLKIEKSLTTEVWNDADR